jgi:hypothetical protein
VLKQQNSLVCFGATYVTIKFENFEHSHLCNIFVRILFLNLHIFNLFISIAVNH